MRIKALIISQYEIVLCKIDYGSSNDYIYNNHHDNESSYQFEFM